MHPSRIGLCVRGKFPFFPAPTMGLSTLKLSTVGCQSFYKFQTVGSLFSCSMCFLLYQSSS